MGLPSDFCRLKVLTTHSWPLHFLRAAFYFLPPAYYLLLPACVLLLTTYCWPLATRYSLHVTRCRAYHTLLATYLLLATRLLTTYCSLLATCYQVQSGRRSVFQDAQ